MIHAPYCPVCGLRDAHWYWCSTQTRTMYLMNPADVERVYPIAPAPAPKPRPWWQFWRKSGT